MHARRLASMAGTSAATAGRTKSCALVGSAPATARATAAASDWCAWSALRSSAVDIACNETVVACKFPHTYKSGGVKKKLTVEANLITHKTSQVLAYRKSAFAMQLKRLVYRNTPRQGSQIDSFHFRCWCEHICSNACLCARR